MSIALATQYAPYTDEVFKAESKAALVTNTDFDWTGAHAIKVYKVNTAAMNNYSRNVNSGDTVPISRYGALLDLSATTEELALSRDRSFIFNIDKLDVDETEQQVEAASALARQLRNVVIPEIDTYVIGKIFAGVTVGNIDEDTLTIENIYGKVLNASVALDEAEVPDTERVLLMDPNAYALLKGATKFDNTDVAAEFRLNGVVGYLDGAAVVKVPSNRMPEGVAFIMTHPSVTVAPIKLEDYSVHQDTPLSSGSIVTGRVCYDAFVLSNKAAGIFVELYDEESSGSGGK